MEDNPMTPPNRMNSSKRESKRSSRSRDFPALQVEVDHSPMNQLLQQARDSLEKIEPINEANEIMKELEQFAEHSNVTNVHSPIVVENVESSCNILDGVPTAHRISEAMSPQPMSATELNIDPKNINSQEFGSIPQITEEDNNDNSSPKETSESSDESEEEHYDTLEMTTKLLPSLEKAKRSQSILIVAKQDKLNLSQKLQDAGGQSKRVSVKHSMMKSQFRVKSPTHALSEYHAKTAVEDSRNDTGFDTSSVYKSKKQFLISIRNSHMKEIEKEVRSEFRSSEKSKERNPKLLASKTSLLGISPHRAEKRVVSQLSYQEIMASPQVKKFKQAIERRISGIQNFTMGIKVNSKMPTRNDIIDLQEMAPKRKSIFHPEMREEPGDDSKENTSSASSGTSEVTTLDQDLFKEGPNNIFEDESPKVDGFEMMQNKNLWEFMFNSIQRKNKFEKLKVCIQRAHDEKETAEQLKKKKAFEEYLKKQNTTQGGGPKREGSFNNKRGMNREASGLFSLQKGATIQHHHTLNFEEQQSQPLTVQHSTVNSSRQMRASQTRKIIESRRMMERINTWHSDGMKRFHQLKRRIKYRFPEEKEQAMIDKQRKFIEFDNSISEEIKANSAFYRKMQKEQLAFQKNPASMKIDEYLHYKDRTTNARSKINHRWNQDPFKEFQLKKKQKAEEKKEAPPTDLPPPPQENVTPPEPAIIQPQAIVPSDKGPIKPGLQGSRATSAGGIKPLLGNNPATSSRTTNFIARNIQSAFQPKQRQPKIRPRTCHLRQSMNSQTVRGWDPRVSSNKDSCSIMLNRKYQRGSGGLMKTLDHSTLDSPFHRLMRNQTPNNLFLVKKSEGFAPDLKYDFRANRDLKASCNLLNATSEEGVKISQSYNRQASTLAPGVDPSSRYNFSSSPDIKGEGFRTMTGGHNSQMMPVMQRSFDRTNRL